MVNIHAYNITHIILSVEYYFHDMQCENKLKNVRQLEVHNHVSLQYMLMDWTWCAFEQLSR